MASPQYFRFTIQDQLVLTEKSPDNLAKELATLHEANKKLPYLESTVVKLNREIAEKDLEIHNHMDDQKEIKNLYRAQLDELVEFQATQTRVKTREDGGLGLEENSVCIRGKYVRVIIILFLLTNCVIITGVLPYTSKKATL